MDVPFVPVNLYVCVCVVFRDGAQVLGETWKQHRGRGVRSVRHRRGSYPPPHAARVPAIPFNPGVHVLPLQPVYKKLLPLYFPRSEEEERTYRPLIPADVGNSEGEPVVPERQIRISEKPGVLEGEKQPPASSRGA